MTTENAQQLDIGRANQLAEELADSVWLATAEWGDFARSSIGLPLTQAVDAIGLQLVLSLGRKSAKEHIQYISNARKYLTPASYWLQRAAKRGLMDPEKAQVLRGQMTALAKLLDQHAHSVMKNKKSSQPEPRPDGQGQVSNENEEGLKATATAESEASVAH